jgi:hypothetical protein
MSLKPGIGATYLDKYLTDIYPTGTVIINGQKQKPPRYYEKRYAELYPIEHEQLSYDRLQRVDYRDLTPSRLADREAVCKAKLTHKKRGFQI